MSSPPGRPIPTPRIEPPLTVPTDLRAAAPRVPPRAPPRVPPRVLRELIVLGALLLFGLIGVPLLTWMAGNRWLGPYTHEQNLHAGPLALLRDYFVGLLHGSAVFWVVALGPLALVLLVRLFIRLVRLSGRPRDDDDDTPVARGRRPG